MDAWGNGRCSSLVRALGSLCSIPTRIASAKAMAHRTSGFRWAGDLLRTSPPPRVPWKEAPSSLAGWASLVLRTSDPLEKATLTRTAFSRLERDVVAQDEGERLPLGRGTHVERPSRPDRPRLLPMRALPKPSDSPLSPNAHVLHNLAHVELNAVDLAWDTVARFAGEGMPWEFYVDFARVADDESRHLRWCLLRMEELGCGYGDVDAHDGLWESAVATKDDLLARLAVVPMVQEARGLDAGPRLASRLVGYGDNRSAEVVRQIAEEEKDHVRVGVVWFQFLCERDGIDPKTKWRALVEQHAKGMLKGPYEHKARQAAGLPRDWYEHPLAT